MDDKELSVNEKKIVAEQAGLDVENQEGAETNQTNLDDSEEILTSSQDNLDETSVEVDLDKVLQENIPVEVEIEGNLVLKELIGEGYYGPVYRVGDEAGNIDFAVKALPVEISQDPDLLEKVRQSFTEATFLNHPNIACVSYMHEVVDDSPVAQELGMRNGSQLIVMECVEGETAHEWSQKFPNKKVDLESVVAVCSQVAAALDYAHEQGMTHRYIKPANVMITYDAEVKILDFGIASEVHAAMNQFSVEAHKHKTPTHFAPEQWSGKRLGPASDQYALATMFYELISGEVPFASALGVGTEVMKNCIINDEPEVIDGLNTQQWNALKKGLAKKPEDRYASCTELIDSISRADEQDTGVKNNNNQILIGAASLLVLIIAVLLGSSSDEVTEVQMANEQVKHTEASQTKPMLKTEAGVNQQESAKTVTTVNNNGAVSDVQDKDKDKDGIPDSIEIKYGLNPNDPADAAADKDGDGFSNIVEYSAIFDGKKLGKSTDINDGKSHPSLTHLLSIVKIAKAPINLIVQKVEAYGDDKKMWSVLIKFDHPKGSRSEYVTIGQTIKLKDFDYTVENIEPKTIKVFNKSVNREEKIDKSVITFKRSKDNIKIKVTTKEKVFESDVTAIIANRMSGKVFKISEKDTISVGNTKTGENKFIVTHIDEKRGIVALFDRKNKTLFTIAREVQELDK